MLVRIGRRRFPTRRGLDMGDLLYVEAWQALREMNVQLQCTKNLYEQLALGMKKDVMVAVVESSQDKVNELLKMLSEGSEEGAKSRENDLQR